MGPIFSWIKFCSSRTNRQSTKVLSVFLKNRLPYLPYLLSSWGIPVFKHKGTGSSNACLQKRKSTSLQVSQGFLLTGPKAKLCKLTQPSQHGTHQETSTGPTELPEGRGCHMLVSLGATESPVCTYSWNRTTESGPREEAVTEGH